MKSVAKYTNIHSPNHLKKKNQNQNLIGQECINPL